MSQLRTSVVLVLFSRAIAAASSTAMPLTAQLPVAPESAGMSSQRLARIDSVFQ